MNVNLTFYYYKC